MFSRWGQENFFKYLAENFDFDRMIQYGTEPKQHYTAFYPIFILTLKKTEDRY